MLIAEISISQLLVSAILGVLGGAIGSFIVFFYWPYLRRKTIWNSLRVVVEPYVEGHGFLCRVVNGSQFTMGKAVAYITIDHDNGLVLPPPPERDAYIKPPAVVPIRQMQLCWAVQECGINPMRVDIYAGEEQPVTLGFFLNDALEIPSEKLRDPARAFLFPGSYKGILKIVSLDCQAKEFPFAIRRGDKVPLVFFPDYAPLSEPGPLPA